VTNESSLGTLNILAIVVLHLVGSPDESPSIFMEALHMLATAETDHARFSGSFPYHHANMTTRIGCSGVGLELGRHNGSRESAPRCNIGPMHAEQLFLSFATGIVVQSSESLSPLRIFARPIVVNTALLLKMNQQTSLHVVAAVIMYNAALRYHLNGYKTEEGNDQAYQAADLHYGASQAHMERALQLSSGGMCDLMDGSLLLLLATWNNRAHLQCANCSVATWSQCVTSMRLLLLHAVTFCCGTGDPLSAPAFLLSPEESCIFHLNHFSLEQLGSRLAPAA
jgi:hypothetical protein